MRLVIWPSYPNLDLDYLDWLFQENAKELIFARQLATSVSQITRRPVLCLHNASMGAPSGWGIPDFKTQLGDLYPAFKEGIKTAYSTNLNIFNNTQPLIFLWQKRLLFPKFKMVLWQLKKMKSPSFTEIKREVINLFPSVLPTEILNEDEVYPQWSETKTLKYAIFLKERYFQEAYRLKELLPLIISLLKNGQTFLRKGVPSFVLPYIDKFIQSTYADKDIDYIKGLFSFVCSLVPETIILFFDETVHPNGPTLKLAIKALTREFPVKGLGVYGRGERVNKTMINSLLSQYQIFFLSAYRGNSRPHSWHKIYNKPFEGSYHPSWRDGLEGIFTGTQVEFLSGSLKREFVITDKGRIPFGTLWRLKLKEYANAQFKNDYFWFFYESLANLN